MGGQDRLIITVIGRNRNRRVLESALIYVDGSLNDRKESNTTYTHEDGTFAHDCWRRGERDKGISELGDSLVLKHVTQVYVSLH